jgi:hypothetical protein
MRTIGFSTGAIAFGDFRKALDLLAPSKLSAIELSALRISEVDPLVNAIPSLHRDGYSYVSLHAPSSYSESEEASLVNLLYSRVPKSWLIVLHPDAIYDLRLWQRFGSRLAIENMDRRKTTGRTAAELKLIFERLPEAKFCFDLGHARQWDSSLTEAFLILTSLQDKLVQIHLSEVNSESQHEAISYGAKLSFQQLAPIIPHEVPIILESRINPTQIDREIENALEALLPTSQEQQCCA